MTTTPPPTGSSSLRQEIERICANGCYGQFSFDAEEKLLALIDREKRKAAEEVLTRLRVPELIDEWGAIDRVLDEMFPSSQ